MMRCEDAAAYFEKLTIEELQITHGLPDEVVEHLDSCLACQAKCYEVLRLMRAWFADLLPIGAKEHIRYHVMRCNDCAHVYDTIAKVHLMRLAHVVQQARFPTVPRVPNFLGYGALGPTIQ